MAAADSLTITGSKFTNNTVTVTGTLSRWSACTMKYYRERQPTILSVEAIDR